MSERSFIFKIVKVVERTFGCITFALNNRGWVVCVDDAKVYNSDKFKNLARAYHVLSRRRKIKILFAYCHAVEERLMEYASKENLIISV